MVDCLDQILIGFFNLVEPVKCSSVLVGPAKRGADVVIESTKLELSETGPWVSEDLRPRPPEIGRDSSIEVAVIKAERLEGLPSEPEETLDGKVESV
jgi:hypothetical protein